MLHVLGYKTDIVSVKLCGRKILSLTSREELRVRVCESRVVRRMFDVRARKEQKDVEDSVVILMTVTVHLMLLT
jgi:hypothetical protein